MIFIVKFRNVQKAALVAIGGFLAACANEKNVEVKTFFRPSPERLEKQIFVVSAQKGEIVRGRYGAILAVPPRVFVDSSGNVVAGEVELELIEAVRWRDLIIGGLQTRTAVGDSLLSTGGMYRIRAFQNGTPLQLKEGKAMFAYFPQDWAEGAAMDLYVSDTTDANASPLWRYAGGPGVWGKCRPKDSDDPCRDCKKLLKKIARIKPQKPPKSPNDWYSDRYAYEGDSLYFYSSGKRTGILSKSEIERCRELMSDDGEARKLFTRVEVLRKRQAQNTSYYAFRLQQLGWYNVDKYIEAERKSHAGTIANNDGKPTSVEIMDKAQRIKLSVQTDSAGRYTFALPPGAKPTVFAYVDNKYVLAPVELSAPTLPTLALTAVDEKDFDATLEKILNL